MPPQEPDTGDWTASWRAAQAAAASDFEREYARAVPALVAWCRLRLGGLERNGIEIEDLVQETWERALARYRDFDAARGSFRSWVIGIAQRVLLEALRHNARQRGFRGSEGVFGTSQCPASITSVSRAAARDEQLIHLLAWIDAQTEEDREFILLRGIEERPLAEVARRFGISEDAAQKRWQRLCERIRGASTLVTAFCRVD